MVAHCARHSAIVAWWRKRKPFQRTAELLPGHHVIPCYCLHGDDQVLFVHIFVQQTNSFGENYPALVSFSTDWWRFSDTLTSDPLRTLEHVHVSSVKCEVPAFWMSDGFVVGFEQLDVSNY